MIASSTTMARLVRSSQFSLLEASFGAPVLGTPKGKRRQCSATGRSPHPRNTELPCFAALITVLFAAMFKVVPTDASSGAT